MQSPAHRSGASSSFAHRIVLARDAGVIANPGQKKRTLSMTVPLDNIKVKKFKCTFEDCSAAFQSQWALVRHMKTHTNERPFPCSVEGCTKHFKEKSGAKRHLSTHSHEKKYHCSHAGCDKKFKGKEYLRDHEKSEHRGETFDCNEPGCGKGFTNRKSLKNHMTHMHQRGGKKDQTEIQLRTRICNLTTCHKQAMDKVMTRNTELEASVARLSEENKQLKLKLGQST